MALGVGNISMTVELLVKVDRLVWSAADANVDSDAVSFPALRPRVALGDTARRIL